MILFQDYISQYLRENDVTEDTLKDERLFEQIKGAYVQANSEAGGEDVFAQTELSKHAEYKTLSELEIRIPNNLSESLAERTLGLESDIFIPDDNGQPSKFGVRQSAYEEYLGTPVTAEDISGLDRDTAKTFYQEFYTRHRINEIEDDEIQSVMFDGVVNQGPHGMGLVAQKVLNSYGENVVEDGTIGSETIRALNRVSARESDVFEKLVGGRLDRYKEASTFDVNGDGWRNRLDSITDDKRLSREDAQTLTALSTPAASPVLTDAVVKESLRTAETPSIVADEEGFVESASRAFGSGFIRGISDVPRAIGILFNSTTMEDAADSIQGIIDAPADEFQQSWLGGLFNGLGQVVSLIGGGVVSGGARVSGRIAVRAGVRSQRAKQVFQSIDSLTIPGASAASSGAVEQVNDYYNTVRERGEDVDRNTELTAMMAGAGIGMLDVVFPWRVLGTGLVGKFTQRFDELTTGSRVRSAVGGTILEGGTEIGQAVLSDVIGDALYDSDPEFAETFNDALNEGSIGGTIGALLGYMFPKGIRKAGGAKVKQVSDSSIENLDAVVEEAEAVIDGATVPSPEVEVIPDVEIVSTEQQERATRSIPDAQRGVLPNDIQPEASQYLPTYEANVEVRDEYDIASKFHKDKRHQQEVYSSYVQAVPELIEENKEIRGYGSLKKEVVKAVETEISTIIEDLEIDLKVQKTPYTSTDQVDSDVRGAGTLSYRPESGGMLDYFAVVQGETQDYTYGEALSALLNIGRIKADTDFGYVGDHKAYNEVHAMFSPLAQIGVATHLRGKIAGRYTNPDNQKTLTEMKGLSELITEKGPTRRLLRRLRKSIGNIQETPSPDFILSAGLTQTNLPALKITDLPEDAAVVFDTFKVNTEAPVLGIEEPVDAPDLYEKHYRGKTQTFSVGNAFRKAADIITPKIEGKTEPGFVTSVKRYIQYDVLNAQNAELRKMLRDAEGAQMHDHAVGTSMIRVYRNHVKEFMKSPLSKSYGKTKNEIEKNFESLLDQMIRGEVELSLINKTEPISEENIRKNDDGDYYFSIGGVPGGAIPREIGEVSVAFIQRTQVLRDIYVDVLKMQQEEVLENISDIRKKISLHEDDIKVRVNEKGLEGLTYQLFEEKGFEWLGKLKTGEAEMAGVRADLYRYFNARVDRAVRSGREITVEELSRKFFEAADTSLGIEEFVKNTQGEFGNMKGMDLDVINALGGFINNSEANKAYKKLSNEYKLYEQLMREAEYIDKIMNDPYYVSRSYKAYEDDVWINTMMNPKTDAEKARRKRYTDEVAMGMAKDAGMDAPTKGFYEQADLRVDQEVRNIESKQRVSKGIGMEGGAYIASASLKRGKLSKAHREFLGEYTDVQDVMALTISRMSRLAVNSMVNHMIYDRFLGHGLYKTMAEARADTTLTTEQFSGITKLVLPKDFQTQSFEGMFATPEIAATLGAFFDKDAATGPMKLIQATSGEFRLFQTVYSVGTGAANIIAGTTGLVSTGGLWNTTGNYDVRADRVYLDMAKAIATGDPTGELLKAYRAVGGSEVKFKDIMRHKELAADLVSKGLNISAKIPVPGLSHAGQGASTVWNKGTKMMMGLYRFGDLTPKVYGYLLNKSVFEKKLGLNKEQSEELAAEVVRYTLFDYDQVPQIVRTIRDNSPLGGGFLSWMSLTFTTTWQSMKYIRTFAKMEADLYGQKNIAGYNPSNPAHVSRAWKGFRTSADFATSVTMMKTSGLMAAMMMQNVFAYGLYILGGMFGDLWEDDDTGLDLYGRNLKRKFNEDAGETKKMMARLLPEYYRDTTKSIMGVNSRGNLEFINTSRLTNYGNFSEAFSVLMNPENDDRNAVWQAMSKLFGDYTNTAFGLDFFINLMRNEDQYKKSIYSEDDSLVGITADVAKYLGNNIYYNQSFKTVVNTFGSLVTEDKYNQYTGEPIEPLEGMMQLVGMRKIEFDPRKSYRGQAWAQYNRRRDSRSRLSSQLRSFNRVSDSSISGYLESAKDSNDLVNDQMLKKIEALRYFGYSDQQILDVTKGTFSKKDMLILLRGNNPPFAMKKIGESLSATNELKNLTGGARRTFSDNYNRAREILNGE